MNKLRVVTRNSNLSIKQVEEVFLELNKNIEYELFTILSYGDKHKEISLINDVPSDFFTKELDEAIIKGEADIAIHSAKDLPFPLPKGIVIAALTKGKISKDALVSKNNLKLKELPAGSKIGISSKLRMENLINIRKDLEIVPIRGTIEERLNLIKNGFVDSIVVAACALERLGLSDIIAELLPFETHPLQGKLAITIRKDRPELLKLFYDLDIRRTFGKVYLVGGGPGDPSLITLKAKKCIEYADIIIYDDLINPEILNYSKRAKKIYAGKRIDHHSIEQNELNKLIYNFAISGKNVVRLKSGDPLIFGRAQEEINFLKQRLIDVEVINGISSAFSSGSDLTISLTNRNCGSKLIFDNGHFYGNKYNEKISCYIFYMGSNSKKDIYNKINKYFPNDTPAIIIRNSSMCDFIVNKMLLKDIPNDNLDSPIIILIGNVCEFYCEEFKVLYTGTNPYESLSKIPGKIVHYPLIEREKIICLPDINFNEFDALLFTSPFAVDTFTDYYGVIKKDIFAIGLRTKERLISRGYNKDKIKVPEKYDSISLNNLLKININYKKILYPCSQISNNVIISNKKVEIIPVYKTVFKSQKKIDLNNYNGIYFSSVSCINSFFKIYDCIPSHLILFAGGRETFNKLKSLGEEKRSIILDKSFFD